MKSFTAIATTIAMLLASTAQAIEFCVLCDTVAVKTVYYPCNGQTNTCSYTCAQSDVDGGRTACCVRIANP